MNHFVYRGRKMKRVALLSLAAAVALLSAGCAVYPDNSPAYGYGYGDGYADPGYGYAAPAQSSLFLGFGADSGPSYHGGYWDHDRHGYHGGDWDHRHDNGAHGPRPQAGGPQNGWHGNGGGRPAAPPQQAGGGDRGNHGNRGSGDWGGQDSGQSQSGGQHRWH